ncbi:glycoside hydrolase family 76 protein [Bacillus sp. FSL K6-3431]|uniref:glycoside hydrolase family 76 protein n=1 Tax=Bacillus sp. FSL K6-3431 TaxID=2921500 RepID=UPI0030F987F9
MKKKVISFSIIILFLLGGSTFAEGAINGQHSDTEESVLNSNSTEWGAKAEQAQASLYDNYWNEETNMFNNAYKCVNCNGQFHYWWQAHAIDTLIDAYERTGEDVHINRATALYDSIIQKNNGITNNFYDDMLWMGMALLRLYEHTNDQEHANAVFTLWEDIKHGWSEEFGGGIAWNKSQLDYKNTPSNAPAVILAARLYQQFGNSNDLEWAKKIYEWQKSTLVDSQTGFVWDGINRTGDGSIDKNWEFTYNQGVYIGASIELYRATKKPEYFEAALQTADTGVNRLVGNHTTNILKDEGSGDGGLFKGVFIRYLGGLVEEDPTQEKLVNFILNNADSAWEHTKSEDEILFGSSWERTPTLNNDLSTNLSGVMLMEQAAKVENNIAVPSFSLLHQQLNEYVNVGDVKGPLVSILNNSLKQVEHHLNKGKVNQAKKHLEKFRKHLANDAHDKHISDQAKEKLIKGADLLIEDWTK